MDVFRESAEIGACFGVVSFSDEGFHGGGPWSESVIKGNIDFHNERIMEIGF